MLIRIFIFVLGTVVTISAATPDGGLQSPFSLGTGARELGLGGSVLATADAITAPYWNPSRLATAEYYSLGAFHSRLFESDVAYQYFGVVIPTLDFGGFGFGVFRLGIDGIEERDDLNLLLGELEDNRMGFYLAYGRSFSGYEVGASVSMESHVLGDYRSTSSPGLTLSLSRRFDPGLSNISDLYVTAVTRNVIAPSRELVDVSIREPVTAELGLSTMILPKQDWDQWMTLSVSLTKVESVAAEMAVGLEYCFQDMLYLRGGFRENRPCFGAGLAYSFVDFDYALVDRDLGSLHMFSLTTVLGRSVSERRKIRLEKREAEFVRMMEEQMTEQNRSTSQQLRAQGEKLLAGEDFTGAVQCFDRALFMTRAAGEDTTEVWSLLQEARSRHDELVCQANYTRFSDSARYCYDKGQYVEARFFARRALEFAADTTEITRLISKIDKTIEREENTEEMLRTQLGLVDSLTSWGEFDRALELLRSIDDLVPGNTAVRIATRKVRFEQQCRRITNSYEAMNYPAALAHIDSALSLMPDHRWCQEMRRKVLRDQSHLAVQPRPASQPASQPARASVLEEAARHYKAGQALFAEGSLQSAVDEWEKVMALAPDYMSVRGYLIKAYKFLGVELYGQNELAAAIERWRKAIQLDPGNTEIRDYIQRAENEIRNLQELSYETGN